MDITLNTRTTYLMMVQKYKRVAQHNSDLKQGFRQFFTNQRHNSDGHVKRCHKIFQERMLRD
jgi:hypothetical protein